MAARLAYLVNQYPKGSHTFIRREIAGLEALGTPIRRISIRTAREALVEPADRAEHTRTHVCLDQPIVRLVSAAMATALRRPHRFLRAVLLSLRMHRHSERGLLRHLAYLFEAAYLASFFEREGIAHVHVHFGTNAAAVARLVSTLGGPGYSMTIHGPTEFDAPVGLSLGAKVADSRFTIAISRYCAAQLRRWVAPDHWPKINVVPCAIDEKFFGFSEAVQPDSQLFVNVGRLTPQKGQLLLLEAFAEVVREHPNARLHLVGDGEMRPLIEAAVRSLELSANVEMTGWLCEEDVRKVVLSSRAAVLPSFAEGLPVVIMEALALGRPVIATAIAGVPELVRWGEGGWLVCAGDPMELANAMKDALEMDGPALDAMAAKGRKRVESRHRVEVVAPVLAELFSRWLGTPNEEE
jgi:colanic acid/amylovoran biosynthesis glycosyltransferase